MKIACIASLLFFGFALSGLSQTMSSLTAIEVVSGTQKTALALIKERGLVLVFHDPSCPFASLYENRIKALQTKFEGQGIGFALVNPHRSSSESDLNELRTYCKEKGLNLPYLIDDQQLWASYLKANKIPEALLLIPTSVGVEVVYKGAIDNNAQLETAVTARYLEQAILQVLRSEKPAIGQVRAVGCTLRSY